MNQHLNGRKHAASLANNSSGETSKGLCFQFQKSGMCSKGALCTYKHIGRGGSNNTTSPYSGDIKSSTSTRSGPPPTGFCYMWWQNGVCSKGFMCTYKHELPTFDSEYSLDKTLFEGNLISPPPQESKRPRQKVGLSTEFFLCKTSDPDINKCNGEDEKSNKTTPAKLASIFCKPVKNEKKQQGRKFPDEFLNLFHRKRDVNLFIQNGLVVWEFAYNARVIKAVKENIKGRAWDPNIGAKGCWTSPLESLPDAIALYEHMGRSASDELKKRSKEVQEKFGGSSASDAIKFVVEISLDKLKNGGKMDVEDNASFGSITTTFLYDADIVSAMKMLAPTQRTYEPTSKAWKIDLLALPTLLENLLPFGYNAPKRLRDLASHVNDVDNLLYGQIETIDIKTAKNADVRVPPPIQRNVKIEIGASGADEIIIIDESEDDEDVCELNKKVKPEPPQSIEHQANALGAKLKAIVDIIAKNDGKYKSFDIADCGSAKRQKLTTAQREWASKYHNKSDNFDNYSGDSFGEHDSDQDVDIHTDFYTKDAFSTFARNRFKSHHSTDHMRETVDCDCGKPFIKVGGQHTCRYFGTFQCSCGNSWTSAYCWKGEMQACRSCNAESLPVKKDKLDGRIGRGDGAHDSARCGRCHTLGYNCSGF